jgi:hypothetical protein
MRKHCSNVCKLRPCLATESTNSARMRTIMTAVLQRQYSQTELIFWITLILSSACVQSRSTSYFLLVHLLLSVDLK